MSASSVPAHLRGNYAPVSDEIEAFDLRVEGELPRALCGRYLRNGPNPRTGTSPHWFVGDGMIHGVRLEDGRARWYRNRWVKTRLLEDPSTPMMRKDLSFDYGVGVNNTHVVSHAGRILALVESSFPVELDPGLETLGVYDFDGALKTAMTAHPKVCPRTGELHFFGYGFSPPLTYHRADAEGRLVQSERIRVKAPTMMHDFAITERFVIFMDLPVTFDLRRMQGGGMPFGWNESYGARVGVMPRGGGDADTRWFEVEPCYVFHVMNAWEEGGRVQIDVARYPELWRDTTQGFDPSFLHRWTIDLERGEVSEAQLDERRVEFPRVDERFLGSRNRFGWAADVADGHAIVRYDLETGASSVHSHGEGRTGGEAVFVPRAEDAPEGEGWLLTYVYDAARDGADLVVLDAADMGAEPVATVRLPRRVPFGFHGSWVPDA